MEYPPDLNYSALELYNIYNRADDGWKSKHYVDSETGLISAKERQPWDVPWDYVGVDIGSQCNNYHAMAKIYNIVPPYCLECWKVVVRPQKHSELITLRNLMRDMVADDKECHCKCGVELRAYVPGLYGGYFYNRGKEAGLKRLQQVREMIDVPVVLKRYCTEFEIALGDSQKYELPEYGAPVAENFINSLAPRENVYQSGIVKMNVYHNWLKFGWKYGTPEDRKEIEDTYNDGKPLHLIPRTYED